MEYLFHMVCTKKSIMKNQFFLFCSILFFNFSISQNIEIIYDQTITFDALITEATYKLVLSNGKSYYYEINKTVRQNPNSDTDFMENKHKVIPFVIKDYKVKSIIYNQPIINKITYIRDSLPLQKWEIMNEVKLINNFKCQKAITNFRGRDYIAWFTPDIQVIGGPWKFDGLPGFILEVSSIDGVLKIIANKINFKKSDKINFNFKKEKFITWDEYKRRFKKVIERLTKSYNSNDEDVEYKININLVEKIE